MRAKVFIDGEAGTTGLLIRERLAPRADIELLSLEAGRRKDAGARAAALDAADLAILCLPDEAARDAVALIRNPNTRIIDASTAHRVADGWAYGFAELAPGQKERIAAARRVANPGCWPTGFLALARPLVDAGLIPRDWPLSVHGVSGYTGGGKAMIAEFEGDGASGGGGAAVRLYAANLRHKHVPEMQRHAGLAGPPLFSPAVGRFPRGMLVEVPLALAALPAAPRLEDIQEVLEAAYAGSRFVAVASRAASRAVDTLDAEAMAGANGMTLHVFGDEGLRQARLVAALDNLGKGASGAAVQNLNLMLGFDEADGL